MRLAVLQMNPKVGDVPGNCAQLQKKITEHKDRADLFVVGEQALLGYPPRDLLSFASVLAAEEHALRELQQFTAKLGKGLLLGHCERRQGAGKPLYNAATLFDSGKLMGRVRKCRIPAYDIFEEERFFEPWTGGPQAPLNFRGLQLATVVCEDSWRTVSAFGPQDVRTYTLAPTAPAQGAHLCVNLSASPYSLHKRPLREDLMRAQAQRAHCAFLYVNCVGGNDDILFDGASFLVNADGNILGQAHIFAEDVLVIEFANNTWKPIDPKPALPFEAWAELQAGLQIGIGDYVRKSGFERVILGLSGGVDSALCAALATKALGKENVLGVSLPSAFTSELSRRTAKELAQGLGIEFRELDLSASIEAQQKLLKLPATGAASENLQSRMRGLSLMAIANQEERLLLTTGNKSELAMGYATLYGDMCGALNPLGDLYKTEVYGLAQLMNRDPSTPVPTETLTRAPSAELAPAQKDSDSLPPYEILDPILVDWIEHQGELHYPEAWAKILAPRFTLESLRKKFHANEFKRYQAPPILKVHSRSFGSGWHMPLAKEVP